MLAGSARALGERFLDSVTAARNVASPRWAGAEICTPEKKRWQKRKIPAGTLAGVSQGCLCYVMTIVRCGKSVLRCEDQKIGILILVSDIVAWPHFY
jgi:hypothetical protein